MNDDVEQRLSRLTPRGVGPELREKVLGAVAGELQAATKIVASEMLAAPKEHGSPSPGQRPGETDPIESAVPAQRANRSANRWPVGPTEEQDHPAYPGRCPGLGEQKGLRPIETTSMDTTTPATIVASPAKTNSPWLRRAAAAVAASLLLGIGLNVWVSKTSEQHLAKLFGPPPVSKRAMEIAKDVEGITDAETGRWVYRRLTAPISPRAAAAARAEYYGKIQKLIDELQTVSKDSYHETLQKGPEMDRDRAGRTGGDSTDCQRHLRLDYRFTA
jgi:hypothetical protein